jgi:hypothetical protein
MIAAVKDVMTSRVVAVRKNAPFKDIGTLLVTLEGPGTVQQGRAILAEVWRVEGVVSVRDRLTYPEGM